VLVLALDTATPAVTAGVVTLVDGSPPRTLARRTTVNARAHGELLTPHVREVVAEAGISLAELDAVVVGAGPGPFTGLRVGMVTAGTLGHVLDRPVHPVGTLDALAADADGDGGLLVATDARRREVYWAAYDAAGLRITGPHVQRPADLAERLPELDVRRAAGQGAELYADLLGLPVVQPWHPSPDALVAVAAKELLTGADPAPLTPLYLRRPDAEVPGARKRVTRP
jgi:tRNA threonylcarbamoyl adenosine modification protein YeaZ